MRLGTAHASVPPNILRSRLYVVGCTRKYEKSKNRYHKEIWSDTTFNIVKIRKIWEKKGENPENLEKRSSEILVVKMEIFSEKNVIEKSWSRKNLSVLPKLGARSPPLGVAISDYHP